MLSQVVHHADPNRVNAYTIVLHVDTFNARDQENDRTYLVFDAATGAVTTSAEFERHIDDWDRVLTEFVDPLVTAGYLYWSSAAEIGDLFRQGESRCQPRRPTGRVP